MVSSSAVPDRICVAESAVSVSVVLWGRVQAHGQSAQNEIGEIVLGHRKLRLVSCGQSPRPSEVIVCRLAMRRQGKFALIISKVGLASMEPWGV